MSKNQDEIFRAIGRIEGKLDEALPDIKEDIAAIKNHLKTQNGRIGKLESWRDKIKGSTMILAALGGGGASGVIIAIMKVLGG